MMKLSDLNFLAKWRKRRKGLERQKALRNLDLTEKDLERILWIRTHGNRDYMIYIANLASEGKEILGEEYKNTSSRKVLRRIRDLVNVSRLSRVSIRELFGLLALYGEKTNIVAPYSKPMKAS